MIKSKSIFIGGIWHETNTFSNKKTYIKDFKSYQWHEGQNMIEKNLRTNTEIGGFLNVFNQKGFRVQPSLFAAAVPSHNDHRLYCEQKQCFLLLTHFQVPYST